MTGPAVSSLVVARHACASIPRFAASAVLAAACLLAPAAVRADAGPGDVVNAPIPAPLIRPGFPYSASGFGFAHAPTVVDFDRDGRSEIFAVDGNGRIFGIADGAVPLGGFPQATGNPAAGPLAVGDVDGDGFDELVYVGMNGRVRVFGQGGGVEADLSFLPSTPVDGALLVEFDTSGKLAIVVVTEDGVMHALRVQGGDLVEFPGWPVNGGSTAASGPFAYLGPDNFPRVGYLGASPARARIYFTYALPDTQASFASASPFSKAQPVSGPRPELFGLPDSDHLYVYSKTGALTRLDPDVLNASTIVSPLNPLPDDSVFSAPVLLDATGDLVPEVAVLGIRGDTTQVWLIDGNTGTPRPGFPRRYLEAVPTGGIVCVDVGDNDASELIFNRGGTRISCVRTNGTEAWSLSGLASTVAPAIGDLDNDGGPDLVVLTSGGDIYAYNLGTSGIGPRSHEWTNQRGDGRRQGRYQLRDRAMPHSFWPPPISPQNAFVTRPTIGYFDGDGRPDVFWSDYATGKTWGFAPGAGPMPGTPQTYARGPVPEAPAIGDITGDGMHEVIQSTSQGYLVWGNSTGTTDFLLVDNNRVLTPPALADLNADGTRDIVVGSSSGRLYAVNGKTKTILPGFPITTAGAISLPPALGDVNGDGSTDIVIVAASRNLVAYPRTGGATPLTGFPRTFASGNVIGQPILVPVTGQTGLRIAFGRATGADSVVASLVGANGAPLPGWPRRLVNAFNLITGPVAGPFDNNADVDIAFATGGDTLVVFNALGNRVLTKALPTPGSLDLAAMVDLDLDRRPDIVVVSDLSSVIGVRFDGLLVRSFTRLLFGLEAGSTPAFGDLGDDGVLDMAISDLGLPVLFSWGPGSWRLDSAPWPMKGHDGWRTNAYSGGTVVGVDDPGAAGPPARGTGLVRATPNPAHGAMLFAHTRNLAGAYEAAIYDLRGRRVRTIGKGVAAAAGETRSWTWDGRDEAGREVAAGVYFYRVTDAAGAMGEKIVRLR